MIKDEEHESDSPGKSPKKISKNSSIDETLSSKLLKFSQHHSSEFSMSETSTADPDAVLLEIIDKENMTGNDKKMIKSGKNVQNVKKAKEMDEDTVNTETDSSRLNTERHGLKTEDIVCGNGVKDCMNETASVNSRTTRGTEGHLSKEDLIDEPISECSPLNMPYSNTNGVIHYNIESVDNVNTVNLNSMAGNTKNGSNDEIDGEDMGRLTVDSVPVLNGILTHQRIKDSIEMTQFTNTSPNHLNNDIPYHSESSKRLSIGEFENTDTVSIFNECVTETGDSTLNNMYPQSQFNTQCSFV